MEYDISRISEIPDTLELLVEDSKITANRCLLRIVSRVIHDKLFADPDFTVFDLKNHKSETLPVESRYNFSTIDLSPNGVR